MAEKIKIVAVTGPTASGKTALAIELAKRLDENTKIVVVGNRETVLNLPPNIIQVGRVENQQKLAEYYSMADLCVVAGKKETFSMPVAEAMCCGTRVVGFKAGGPESISIPQYSEFVENGDTDALCAAVKRALDEEYDKNQLAADAKAKYSRSQMTDGYIKAYERVFDKKEGENMTKIKELLKLYAAFFRIGAFTFGGGYAMLPMLEKEIVEKYKWATMEELMDYFAIGQCTPGVIAVNTATFIGHKKMGVIGGIVATLGVITPSIIIISLIALVLDAVSKNSVVQHAFAGIGVAVCAVLIQAVTKIGKAGLVDKTTWVIGIGAFLMTAVFEISTILIIILAGVVGVICKRLKTKANKESE